MDQSHILQSNNLDNYILNETNIKSYLKYDFLNQNNKYNSEKLVKSEKSGKINRANESNIFIPKEYDTLFWCYFIIKNGDVKYELLNVRNTLVCKQLKIEFVESIRQNKQIVKTYKFDTITNIENNLVNENNISIKTIMTLCAIDNINLIFISRKSFFELLMNDDKPIYIIREFDGSNYKNSAKKYGFEIANSSMLEDIRSNLFKLDKLDKPIKALSSYKVQELIDISRKLDIEIINKDTGKNKTKNELYEALIQFF